jgi:hypothetical protein
MSSIFDELKKAQIKMPPQYLEITSKWVRRAKENLRRASSMLSSGGSPQQINAAVALIQEVSNGLQYAVNLISPYQGTDPDATELAAELQQIQAMLQNLQQRVSEIMLKLSLHD